jgi:CubicO group peptidase (beta-lactamase class C family)
VNQRRDTVPGVDQLRQSVDDIALRTGFSGAIRVDDRSGQLLAAAYGLAHRAHGIANTVDTRFAVASGTKGLTALTVVALIEQGRLSLDAAARSVLGKDLPLIDDAVTVEHLLGHRSGIGDYVDEDVQQEITDYVIPIPVHQLTSAEHYLPVLAGHPQKFPPGERFSYCNSGYVVLALIAQRTGGAPFAELVQRLVCEPAGMTQTEFLRSDELPAGAAVGYLTATEPRTNVLHLPVVGSGDGGIYSTLADFHSFWPALFGGRILPAERVAGMVAPRSEYPEESRRYGLGFWLRATGDTVFLEGYDAGVSFRSVHNPVSGVTHTVVSNWSNGAWPVTDVLAGLLQT